MLTQGQSVGGGGGDHLRKLGGIHVDDLASSVKATVSQFSCLCC